MNGKGNPMIDKIIKKFMSTTNLFDDNLKGNIDYDNSE